MYTWIKAEFADKLIICRKACRFHSFSEDKSCPFVVSLRCEQKNPGIMEYGRESSAVSSTD